jgi:hypothetical protein
MARPYKKRSPQKPDDFKICDLKAMKEKCLCSIDQVCVCSQLKGICTKDSGTNASIALQNLQPVPDSSVPPVLNGFAAMSK